MQSISRNSNLLCYSHNKSLTGRCNQNMNVTDLKGRSITEKEADILLALTDEQTKKLLAHDKFSDDSCALCDKDLDPSDTCPLFNHVVCGDCFDRGGDPV